ncbi:hypothetical protein K466DRAFT_664450 [Polyporus arcularius HHB13444]|uniref:F-box domain-containing protein n=1 Tax=Polyporus arcularius HHB13444 TaxID=1314778 RepID=A0A5C3P776_9APHY|nr:hypothetical protein K466DRAFT_664450 [Polyporus arcularius HHB13444]
MADTLPSQVDVCLRVPVEVWEHVIEAAYNERYGEVPVAFATLCSCALVCRVWCPCAQQVLFNYVVLRDKAALYRFAELVDAYPKLGTYVRMLALRGYLHVPYSPAVLFLTALGRRLTNLSALSIHGFDDDEKAAHPLPEGHKELPCLPFHRYFPSLLTSISHIRRLSLRDVRFASFGDFARFLSALCNLGDLFCTRISWSVLGVDPACFNSGETFLPNLKTLLSYDMEEEGRQRLLSGLGASLCEFRIKFPNNLPALRVDHPGELYMAIHGSLPV